MIDMHTHLKGTAGYAERMVEAEKAIGVHRFVTFAAGPGGDWATNAQILAAAEKHAEIIPFAYVQLGKVTPRQLGDCVRQGFKGFKCINPSKPYNDDAFMPLYARMEELGVPVLFHTGIVGGFGNTRAYDIDTYRHKVIFLDRAVRKFTGLNVIGAHLGNPDYAEAAMLTRWHPNLYFDISGSTLKAKKPEFFSELFWWSAPPKRSGKPVLGTYNVDPFGRGPWEKIVFGTDVDPSKVAEVKADYDRLMDALELPADIRAAIFGGTAAKLLGLSGAEKPKRTQTRRRK
jgi:hypothetical protein